MSAPPYRIVIVGCGQEKLDGPAPAAALYTGQYFQACRRAAVALAGPRWWYILSARYGLVGPRQVLEPYDLRLGQPGSVTAGRLREQATLYRLLSCRVTALCGADYADLIAAAWPAGHVDRPLAHLGIGEQLHELALMARGPRRDILLTQVRWAGSLDL